MRAELRAMIGHTELLSEHEIGFTVEYCKAFGQSHWNHTHRPFEGANLQDHGTIEALSDANFRTAYQEQYIYQLGLWRMVAVFDAILKQWFPQFATKRLQACLTAVARITSLPPEELGELKEWIDLRNTLSHTPADAPSFAHQLRWPDLEELEALMKRALAVMRSFASPAGVA